ncbi:MAG TPA: J domain-containing protein [Candidatus Limnocylindrales bacterium]|nr:J domain-containing protein [Candidatus Limnocylindrales bacterium]
MKAEVKRWLASQITAVPSVRSCLIDREADLAVRTWSATVTFIYLLDELVKPRHLRKVVNDNSRVGIGTLFLLNAALAPPDGTKLEPAETLLALHALHRDKLYTWSDDEAAPTIGQVHFKSFGRMHEYETWYGPAVEIQHLPCYRVWVKSPHSIKGDWLIATFGTETFWKHADYAIGRDAMRRQQRGGFTERASWSSAQWNGGPRLEEEPPSPPPASSPPLSAQVTRLDICYACLGVAGGASSDEVKAAFRRRARELHPDVSPLPKEQAEKQFRLLNEAYDFIKVSNGW